MAECYGVFGPYVVAFGLQESFTIKFHFKKNAYQTLRGITQLVGF